MGTYTEFYFRANTKNGPITDWLNQQINGDDDFFRTGYNDHDFFECPRWSDVFIGGGAVYQESRIPILRPNQQRKNELVIASSLKNYGNEIGSFIRWIDPHLDMCPGDFLGYSLHEDSTDDSKEYREHPVLYFHQRQPVDDRIYEWGR